MGEERRSGLLIDWGGVMTSDVFEAFRAFSEDEGLELERVRDLFLADEEARELLAGFERGSLEPADFERRFGALLGVRDHEGLIRRLFAGLRQERRMQDAVAAYRRAGIRTGLLSNSWGGESYDRDRFDELFDVLVVSGEEGMRKPEPEIYALATERMALPASELVFVDDLPGNLKPARALGMATVVHRDVEGTLAELEELLGPLPAG